MCSIINTTLINTNLIMEEINTALGKFKLNGILFPSLKDLNNFEVLSNIFFSFLFIKGGNVNKVFLKVLPCFYFFLFLCISGRSWIIKFLTCLRMHYVNHLNYFSIVSLMYLRFEVVLLLFLQNCSFLRERDFVRFKYISKIPLWISKYLLFILNDVHKTF